MMQENMGAYYGPSFYHTPPDWAGHHEAREFQEKEVVRTVAAPVVIADTVPDFAIANRVSWGAVAAGVVMMLAAQLVFSLMGLGLAAAGITQAATHMPAAMYLFLICLWLAASGIAAAFIGGFAAGRMAGRLQAAAAGWHGLVSWAVSVMAVAFLLVNATNMIAGDIYQTTLYRGLSGVSYEQGHLSGSSLTEGPTIPTAPSAIPQQGISIDQAPAQTAPQYSLRVTSAPGTLANELASFGLLSAAALLLGALAAWFGGRASTRKKEVRVRA